jgi:hypothetical protein
LAESLQTVKPAVGLGLAEDLAKLKPGTAHRDVE